MQKSPFQSPLGRALILTFAVTALSGYVAMVSCSRTAEPSLPAVPVQSSIQAPAAVAAPVVTPPPANAAAAPMRVYGPATKSDLVMPWHHAPGPQTSPSAAPPPAGKSAPKRFYGSATKSIFIIKPPAPAPQAAPAAQK
jgi:hypothetical protein